MRKLLIAVLLTIPTIFSFSQDKPFCCPFSDVFPLVNNTITYTEVIQEAGSSTEDLYKRAKIWMVDAFKSSKDVIQNDDKDNFIIIGKGFFDGIGHNENIVNAKYWFTIRIDCRDGRYKYSITDFIYDFDVAIMGTKTHFSEDFSKWGNVPFNTKYEDLLNTKFPPNDKRNTKQQEKYEKYKQELDNELESKYRKVVERYLILDTQIKSAIDSLKKAMKQSTNDDW